jgi:hypothetical protein
MPLSSVVGAQSIIRPGVCTSSTRPASPYDGQVIYETDTDKIAVYDSSAWVYKTGATAPVAPGLVVVKTQTIGSAVSSVTVTDAFSSTYDNYKITVNGGVASTDDVIGLQLGATTTGYYAGFSGAVYSSGAASVGSNNNTASFTQIGYGSTDSLFADFTLTNPFATKKTFVSGGFAFPQTTNVSRSYHGFVNNTTSYTAFTLTPGSGTFTGGTIRVYGYANS